MMMEDPRIHARLCCDELWKQFHSIGNEMIVTKGGRRLFPRLEYELYGLDPQVNYSVYLRLEPVDIFRRRFTAGEWSMGTETTTHINMKTVKHQDESASGDKWMKKTLSFNFVKITNNLADESAHIIPVLSMSKYIPVLEIHYAAPGATMLPPSPNTLARRIVYQFMEFVAVTAYQNAAITRMKIDMNPFAKGFRTEAMITLSKKRKRVSSEPDSGNSSMESLTESPSASAPKLPKMMSHAKQETPFFPGFYPGYHPGGFNYMAPFMPHFANMSMGGNMNYPNPPGMNMFNMQYPHYPMFPFSTPSPVNPEQQQELPPQDPQQQQLLQYPETPMNSMMMYPEYTSLQ